MVKIEEALDDCLEQLSTGKSSLGQCLNRYPQYAAELRPLLETALRLQQGRQVRPAGATRDRARATLVHHIQAHPRPASQPFPRLAAGLVVLILAAFMVTTAFAQAAMPGDALYRLKLSSERVWRATSSDPLSVDLRLADRRADELVSIAQKGSKDDRSEEAETEAINAYSEVLDRLTGEANAPGSSEQILTALHRHQEELSKAGIHVPKLDDAVPPKNGPEPKKP